MRLDSKVGIDYRCHRVTNANVGKGGRRCIGYRNDAKDSKESFPLHCPDSDEFPLPIGFGLGLYLGFGLGFGDESFPLLCLGSFVLKTTYALIIDSIQTFNYNH
jgi:hypothetical protein